MKLTQPDFSSLESDEVLMEGMVASDVASLWRRLARTAAVQHVARSLASDEVRIRRLCDFIKSLLDEVHDQCHRHPNDVAICAGLVVLEQSPLDSVRSLIAYLRRANEPSLVWVRRMAEYCDGRWMSTITITEKLSLPVADDEDTVSVGSPGQYGAIAPGCVCLHYNIAAA